MHAAEKKVILMILLGCSFFCREKAALSALREPVVTVWAQAAEESGGEADKAAVRITEEYFLGNDSFLFVGAAGILVVFVLIMIRLYVHSHMWKP